MYLLNTKNLIRQIKKKVQETQYKAIFLENGHMYTMRTTNQVMIVHQVFLTKIREY